MKRLNLVVVVFVLIAQCAWSQNNRPWSSLKWIEEKYYVEYNGEDFLVNPSLVTVKFKDGVTQSKMPLDIIRTSRHGFMRIQTNETIITKKIVKK